MIHGHLAEKLNSANTEAANAEQEVVEINARNQQLASRMLSLAEAVESQDTERLDDMSLQEELNDLDRGIRDARRDWRLIKSLISGVIVGSGIDWATDTRLLELVLDEDEEVG
jgi:F0F1-type ATP synthase assembly protein I